MPFQRPAIVWSVWALLLFAALAVPSWPAPRFFCLFLTGGVLSTQELRIPAIPWKLPDISYGVYLYGWPVQKLLTWWGVTDPYFLMALALAISGGCGWLSYVVIEKRAMALRPQSTGTSAKATTLQ